MYFDSNFNEFCFHALNWQCVNIRLGNGLAANRQQAITWWRHQMETFSALLALCVGNSPVTGEFPSQRPVTRSFGVFFHLCLNNRLSKQWWGWWFETPSRSLWRHCNGMNQLWPSSATSFNELQTTISTTVNEFISALYAVSLEINIYK